MLTRSSPPTAPHDSRKRSSVLLSVRSLRTLSTLTVPAIAVALLMRLPVGVENRVGGPGGRQAHPDHDHPKQ